MLKCLWGNENIEGGIQFFSDLRGIRQMKRKWEKVRGKPSKGSVR